MKLQRQLEESKRKQIDWPWLDTGEAKLGISSIGRITKELIFPIAILSVQYHLVQLFQWWILFIIYCLWRKQKILLGYVVTYSES